jgi:surface carbohydrate biosynthesis protein
MSLDVALVVDNPLRDLGGATLVANTLAAQGATAHLVPMEAQEAEMRALAPDVVVVNYLRPTNAALVSDLLDAEVSVVVLDTEGGVFVDLDEYGRTLPANRTLRESVFAFCMWGPRLAEHGIARGWYLPEQVVVTGSPRFDYYVDPWRTATTAMVPDLAGIETPILLFNGNFPLANPRFQSPEQERELLISEFGWDAAYVDRAQALQRQGMIELSRLASHTAARHPAITVVYRPHPFENRNAYRGLIKDGNNLRVAQTGSVDSWILRSRLVAQRSCTTAVESALAGIPGLSPRWIPTVIDMEVAEAVSVPCISPNDFDEAVDRVLDGEDVRPASVRTALDAIVFDWFSRIDGDAHRRVADVVMNAPLTGAPRTQHVARCRAIGSRNNPLLNAAKRLLPPEIRRLSFDAGVRARGSSKLFRARTVSSLLDALAASGAPRATAGRPSYSTGLPFGRSVTVVRG